jgi:excisionase family DNA binding protein
MTSQTKSPKRRANDAAPQPTAQGASVGVKSLRPAATFLGISEHTLRAWARQRRIPYIRLGRRLLFAQPDLESFLNAHRVEALVVRNVGPRQAG